jgi:hypothetical protein
VFVFRGRLERCTLWGIVGVAGQYAVGPALASLTGQRSPLWFAVGYTTFYALSVLPLWRELRRERAPEWTAREISAA